MKQPILTIDDLVKLATNPYETNRYRLNAQQSMKYVNPELGEQWTRSLNELDEKFQRQLGEWYSLPEYRTAREQLDASQPEQVKFYQYWLVRTGTTGYRHYTIDLEEGLGSQIEKIWMTKPAKYGGSPRLVGALTLAAILRRLGRTDIQPLIKNARAEHEERRATERRENAIRRVRETGADLRQALASAKEEGVAGLDAIALNLEEILNGIGAT